MGYVKQIIGAMLALPASILVLSATLSFNLEPADRLFYIGRGVLALPFLLIGIYLIRAGRRLILER